MTILLNVIKGLRHGEERPREAGRVSNHARRWMLRILAQPQRETAHHSRCKGGGLRSANPPYD
jgi:hypothetical protein